MKAVLVIDMPTDCIKCPLGDGYCWNVFPIKGKANDCPLRPLPQRKEIRNSIQYRGLAEKYHKEGWNDCLDEITGAKDVLHK